MMIVDARGRSCPEPVIMTKKALDASENEVTVLVDDQVPVDNITRFATNQGYTVEVKRSAEEFTIRIFREEIV